MPIYYDENVDPRPINYDHALAVEAMHAALPWHERMVIISEYTQKNSLFGGMDARARIRAALRWIETTTGTRLTEGEYKIYLGMFRNEVERKIR
ncbi:hypothetical protein [Achromobacter sp.]|uniref:hypothetical protein n=1 Tax=Achromobacter sp. TaxID=134375 RepID=UPI0025909679|nr:hypothetical protein [Achromobacter sp.]